MGRPVQEIPDDCEDATAFLIKCVEDLKPFDWVMNDGNHQIRNYQYAQIYGAALVRPDVDDKAVWEAIMKRRSSIMGKYWIRRCGKEYAASHIVAQKRIRAAAKARAYHARRREGAK
jgi:hypothetical protein